jgi:hypothetical protein
LRRLGKDTVQGNPAEAVKRARQSVKDAASMGHPVPLSRALVWAVSVFLWQAISTMCTQIG